MTFLLSFHNASGNNSICPTCRANLSSGCCSRSIVQHWTRMTPEVRMFILHQAHLGEDGFISMGKLLDFWSSPLNAVLTRRIDICSALWHLVSRKSVSYSASSLGRIPARIRIWWKEAVLNKNTFIDLTLVLLVAINNTHRHLFISS